MAGRGKVARQQIPLGVDVGRDMVGDLAGVMADADAAINRSPRPARPAEPVVALLSSAFQIRT